MACRGRAGNPCSASLHRTTYAEVERRSRRLVRVLEKLGVGFGDRVATLAWNDYRHLELYYGVSGMGAVCHTVNLRLAVDDIAFIMRDAEDCVIFGDPSFAALIKQIAPSVSSSVRSVVAMTDEAGMPDVALAPGMRLYCYETLMAEADEDYVWPGFDENTAPSATPRARPAARRAFSTAIGRRCSTPTHAIRQRLKQGRAACGTDMKIVDAEGRDLPWDGKAFGDFLVRGHWVCREYLNRGADGAAGADGWIRTGDVCTIDPDGCAEIVDRSKDVIKSGGEWISSIALENIAVSHPAVAEAAVVGAKHPNGRSARSSSSSRAPARRSTATTCSRRFRARSRSGGSPTMSWWSRSCRTPRPASSTSSRCAPSFRITLLQSGRGGAG